MIGAMMAAVAVVMGGFLGVFFGFPVPSLGMLVSACLAAGVLVGLFVRPE